MWLESTLECREALSYRAKLGHPFLRSRGRIEGALRPAGEAMPYSFSTKEKGKLLHVFRTFQCPGCLDKELSFTHAIEDQKNCMKTL